MTDARTVLIKSYIERGWQPIHLPARSKNPGFDQWQRFTCTVDEVERYFPANRNVGMLLGKPSNGLVDVDLDSPEAISLARQFLPRTEMVHGRTGKPMSHWWYVCSDHTPEQVRRFRDVTGETLCELRSTGGQTIVPPSTHDTGETIEWASEGEPADIDGRVLESDVSRLAACALLARHWPSAGSRHDVALALAGALLRHGWDTERAVAFIVAAARVAGDDELTDREECVHSTAKAIRQNKAATGIPRLAEIIGKGVVDRLFEWLGISETVEAPQRWTFEDVAPLQPIQDGFDPNAWRAIIDKTDIPIGDLPYWFGRLIQRVRPYTPMFPDDWALMMALPFWSSLWPGVRLQNLNLAIWTLGIGTQGIGKNVATDEMLRIVRMARSRSTTAPTIYTAGSPEGMWDALSGDGKQLICYQDEFGGYLKLLQRDHMQSAREALCSLYDGRVVGYLRSQKNGVEISNPHVVVAATTTPAAIREFATQQDMTNGYLSRFMVCAPDAKSRMPEFFPESVDFEREELVKELDNHLDRFRNIERAVWQDTGRKDPPVIDEYRQHLGIDNDADINLDEASDDTAIPGGRLLARAKKIATLLEIAEANPEVIGNAFAVRSEHALTAIALVERSRAYAERLRGWVGASKDVELSHRAFRYIEKHKAISQRDLCRFMKVNVKEVRDALDLLEGAGMAHPKKSGKVLVWMLGRENAA